MKKKTGHHDMKKFLELRAKSSSGSSKYIYLRQNSSALTKHAKLKDNQQRRICSMAQFLIMNQPMQYLLIRQNEKRRFCKV